MLSLKAPLCCSYNKRIANLSDPAVQDVLKSREWPRGGTAEACRMYAEMMRLSCDPADDGKDGLTHDAAKGVSFTNKGDRAAVKYAVRLPPCGPVSLIRSLAVRRYNFFKMTMSKESIGL